MKKKKRLSGLGIKRLFYEGRILSLKSMISAMVVMGFLFAALYLVKYIYIEYAVSRADITLGYPEIANSTYPNKTRFTYYSFIDDEMLQKALEAMQKKGMYENFTVDDLKNQFYLYSDLKSSAGASVSSARSEGDDFYYVSNEYKITFVQPHVFRGNIFNGIFASDESDDFLIELLEANRTRFAETMGGINSFKSLTAMDSDENYDYNETVKIYTTKVNTVIRYLDYLNSREPDFASYDGVTLNRLKGEYQLLISNSLKSISNLIDSSGISKDTETAVNKLRVNIENNTLKYRKYSDRGQINRYAMEHYDQTFTENLINVIQNDEYGLYQARPKTAFDTVVNQKHKADESAVEYNEKLNILSSELYIFENAQQNAEEYERLKLKCRSLIEGFKEEFDELSVRADKVVREYYNYRNADYMYAKVKKKSLMSKKVVVKAGFAFFIGMIFAFITAVFLETIRGNREVRRKRALIRSIKENGGEES